MGMLLAARFVLGIGIGGCYPLASSKGSEECGSNNSLEKNQAVGLIFFWQVTRNPRLSWLSFGRLSCRAPSGLSIPPQTLTRL